MFGHEDPEVDRHLYAKLMGSILKDKTVLLRTNNDLILKRVNSILVFDGESIIPVTTHKEYTRKYSFDDSHLQLRIKGLRNYYDRDFKKPNSQVYPGLRMEDFLANIK